MSIQHKEASREEYDKTIVETQAAYMKILESSQTLLNVLKVRFDGRWLCTSPASVGVGYAPSDAGAVLDHGGLRARVPWPTLCGVCQILNSASWPLLTLTHAVCDIAITHAARECTHPEEEDHDGRVNVLIITKAANLQVSTRSHVASPGGIWRRTHIARTVLLRIAVRAKETKMRSNARRGTA